jgi:hypothetical protein
MNYCEQITVENAGCPSEEAHKVEAAMRLDVFHSTLNWQSRAESRRGRAKRGDWQTKMGRIMRGISARIGSHWDCRQTREVLAGSLGLTQ